MSRSLTVGRVRGPRIRVPHDGGIIKEFVESVNSSLGCRSGSPRCAEYEWSGGVRDYQARVLADVLSHYLAGVLTGYVRAVPGTGTSVIESLIPLLIKEAGLGGGLYTIVTPRLVAMTEITGNIVRILDDDARFYSCNGGGECRDVVDAAVRESDDKDVSVLVITYQMLVTLYRYYKDLLKELGGRARGVIFDYPDVNGVGDTLTKVINELIEERRKLALAFTAWENSRIEGIFQDTEIARIMMEDVRNYLAEKVAFAKLPHGAAASARKASEAVHRILTEAVGPGTRSPYTTALLVTESKNRAEELRKHLTRLGHNVVTVSHDRVLSRRLIEEQKSRRKIIIETGSLSAGYSHKDLDVLILDTKTNISRYAVYRGIVTRSHNTISRLKGEFRTSVILDISGRNDVNETAYCRAHDITTHKKTARDTAEILRRIKDIIHSGKSGSHLIIHAPTTRRPKQGRHHRTITRKPVIKDKKKAVRRGLNEAIQIVLIKGGTTKVCNRIILVRKSKSIKVLLKEKGATRYLATVPIDSFDQVFRRLAEVVRKHCKHI